MVDGKMTVIKYLMFFFNLLFWISGIVLIVIGSYLRDKYGEYLTFADNKYSDAAVFLIVIGVVVFIIGFLGCCGAIKENYCMVTSFAVLLIIIFILELAAGVLGFVYKGKVESVAEDTLKRGIREYKTEGGAHDFIDFVQRELHCCGFDNATDWLAHHGNTSGPATAAPTTAVPATTAPQPTTAAANSNSTTASANNATTAGPTTSAASTAAPIKSDIPSTCCTEAVCTTANSYKVGCHHKFETFLKDQLLTIGGIGVGVAFLQILGIVFACLLMRSIKGEYEVV